MDDDALFPNFPDWQKALSAYLQTIQDKTGSPNTWKNYRCILRMFFCDKTRDPASYAKSDVIAFTSQLSQSVRSRGKPLAANSKNCRVSCLRSFYRFASEYDLLQADGTLKPLFTGLLPTRGIKHIARDKKPRNLTEDELEAFFQGMDTNTVKGTRDRALFLLFFYTARRRMELLRLRVGDIYRDTLIDADGTRREAWVYRFQGKGRSRETEIAELPQEAYTSLTRYWEVSGRKATLALADPLFLALRPGSGRTKRSEYEPLAPSSVHLLFSEYLVKANLTGRGLSIHSLRHTAASIRHTLGQDILEINKLLRHQHLKTTMDYIALMSGRADTGAKLVEARFKHLTPR